MNTYTANYKTFRRSSIFSADNLFARRALKALLIGTALAALLTVLSPLFVGSAAVRQDTLRLHVLANSDSAEDQAVKLLVRDAILEAHSQVLGEAKTKADAIRRATEMLPEIEKIANEVLRENGFSYSATAKVENIYFATKDYGDFTLPAGRYDALRIELGRHEGKNWFCVLFPPLCVPSAVDADEAPEYTGEEQALVSSPYRVEFAAVEAFEGVKEWTKNTFFQDDSSQK